MADHTGVCEVPNTLQVPLGHLHGDGQEGHAIGDVDHFVVSSNLCDEVPGVAEVR